jgi:hypothetical protein
MKSVKDSKKLLTSLGQVVVFLFSAYGGFLKRIAPPDETGTSYAVGVLSFLVLIVLLIVSAAARRAPGTKYRKAWLTAGIVCFAIAIPSALLYPKVLDKYTYSYPPEKPTEFRIKGDDTALTQDAKEWIQENPRDASPGTLARKLPKDDIWTPTSIEHSRSVLLGAYALLVLSLATAIFCLLEASVIAR